MILFWLFFPQMREARSNIFIKQARKAGLQRAAKRDFTAFLFCCNEKKPCRQCRPCKTALYITRA